MSSIPRVYWDASCFISLINQQSEPGRHEICQDVLKHAQNDQIEIWTSCWSIVETIRPRDPVNPVPLPDWAVCLEKKNKKGESVYPNAKAELERVWNHYHKCTRPSRLLSPEDAKKIRQMFMWSWIHKIQVAPVIAHRAAEIARQYNMGNADALHVASALHRGCSEIHRWDRDYSKTDTLIQSREPERISPRTLFSGTPELVET